MQVDITTQTLSRIEAQVRAHGLEFRVVASIVFGDCIGSHAFVAGRGDDEAAYAHNSDLHQLGDRDPVVALHEEFTKALQGVSSNAAKVAEFIPCPDCGAVGYGPSVACCATCNPALNETSDEELEEQARWEYELDQQADRDFAADRERLAEAGSWWGHGDSELEF